MPTTITPPNGKSYGHIKPYLLGKAFGRKNCKLPTQLPDGRSRCFCCAVIEVANMDRHVYAAHMRGGSSRTRFPRPISALGKDHPPLGDS
jgi:hypothetical protein